MERSLQGRPVTDSLSHSLCAWVLSIPFTVAIAIVLQKLGAAAIPESLDASITQAEDLTIATATMAVSYASALAIARRIMLGGIDVLEKRRWRRFRAGATLGAIAALAPSVLFDEKGPYSAGTPWLYVLVEANQLRSAIGNPQSPAAIGNTFKQHAATSIEVLSRQAPRVFITRPGYART